MAAMRSYLCSAPLMFLVKASNRVDLPARGRPIIPSFISGLENALDRFRDGWSLPLTSVMKQIKSRYFVVDLIKK